LGADDGCYVPNVALYQAKLRPDIFAREVSRLGLPGGRKKKRILPIGAGLKSTSHLDDWRAAGAERTL